MPDFLLSVTAGCKGEIAFASAHVSELWVSESHRGQGVGGALFAEGFATAATLREETGHTTVGAMFAGNLLAVYKALRARYPDLAITVAGDDDRATAGNPGRMKAIEAADAVGGRIAFPTFCDRCDGSCTDFNDVAQCEATCRTGVA